MDRLKQLVLEIHRRSLWQVMIVYLGASWGVLEAIDFVVDQFLLPDWVSGAAIVLLLIELPIVLATATVRETPTVGRRASTSSDPTRVPSAESDRPARQRTAGVKLPGGLARALTWPRAILGGVLAFALLAAVSAFIVLKGVPRVAEAEGAAGAAFSEQAWLVLADFEASDPEAREVATAARAALTVDLEQSRHVNLYSSNQVERVLRRMGRPDTARLHEGLALEVAEREGLGGVLAAEVSRLGSDYVIAARVVEPEGGDNLVAVRAVARGDRLTEGVEKLSRELRVRLGERAAAIQRSKPLPQVTTRSLEALKKYGQAVDALGRERDTGARRAAELAKQAIELDSTFAMAWRLASVAYNNTQRLGLAAEYAERAYALRERLTDRERLHVEAFQHYLSGDPRRAAEAYEILFSQYPDDWRAANNLSVMAGGFLGDRDRAFEAMRRATQLHGEALHLNNLASAARWTGRDAMVDSLIGAARERGFGQLAVSLEARRAITTDRWPDADETCATELASGPGSGPFGADMLCGSLAVARGRLRDARSRLEAARERFGQQGRLIPAAIATTVLSLADEMAGRQTDVTARYDWLLGHFPPGSENDPNGFYARPGLVILAGLLERPELRDRVEDSYGPLYGEDHWTTRYSDGLIAASHALGAGNAERAVERSREVRRMGYEPFFWTFWTDLLSGLAFAESARYDSAVHHLERAMHPGHLGGAIDEARAFLPVVLRRLAEVEEARGNPDAAVRRYRQLLELWSDADPELAPRIAAVRRALARLSDREPD